MCHMQTTIYIRKENQEFWESLEDKSNFVNALLSKERSGNQLGHENVGRLQDELIKRKKSVPEIPGVVKGFVPKPPDPETGYPCCVKKTRCKHWQWDGDNQHWVNVLTGKTREE